MKKARMDTLIGGIWIIADEEAVHQVAFSQKEIPKEATQGINPILQKSVIQLEEYFQGARKGFDLPLAIKGTPFQQRVYAELLKIPYGEKRSYKQIAEALGSPGAMRAVGGANNKNPIPILVPCHRVIGADGSLVGYGGGLEKKRFLLELEEKHRA